MPDIAAAPLGILGGTFDPIHAGHLRLAEEACDQLGLAAVRWLPAGQPTHRHPPASSATHRLEMVRIAIAGNPRFHLDDHEAHSTAPSYTVPTLQRLRATPGVASSLVLLLGADAFLGLESWHCWRELFALAHIAVATRPGTTIESTALSPALSAEFAARKVTTPAAFQTAPAGHILSFPFTALDISATQLRAQLKTGHSPRYLLPDPVLDYIFSHHLYS